MLPRRKQLVLAGVLSCLLQLGFRFDAVAADLTLEQLRHVRQEAAHRQRRVIFNNDGNEPVYLCADNTPEELLKQRTSPLAGTQVDSIFYCTWSSGFGMFTHGTKEGHVFKTKEDLFKKNRIEEMLAAGTDPLQVMVDFGKKNDIEIFWSFRMNDTHDAGLSGYGPVMFRANPLKLAHPEWLIGTAKQRPKFGGWSAVDYTLPEIRTLALKFVEEVCANYDVDGIELDFFRHPVFFKRAAQTGTVCNDEERELMTSLMREIRTVTETQGLKRGRPILLAVRIPDSADYSHDVGLDMETWLKEGLIDLLMASGYFRLNEWETTVKLGNRHQVPVYASLDESRVRDADARKMRMTIESYRGRALSARQAGAAGVYLFNAFDPQHRIWRELGDPETLKQLDQDYFASIRGVGAAAGGALPHRKYQHVPTLNPHAPVQIAKGEEQSVEFQFAGDPSLQNKSRTCEIRLRLRFDPVASDSTQVSLNGTALSSATKNDKWIEFVLEPKLLHSGKNKVTVKADQEALTWHDLQCSLRWKNAAVSQK